MLRFILAFIVVLAVGGCTGIPLMDAFGQPVLDESGAPVVEQKFDADKLAEGAGAVGVFLPPPWNLIAPIIGSLAVALTKKG